MKECDIFKGSKHTVTPPAYLQGVRTPKPKHLRPCLKHMVTFATQRGLHIAQLQFGPFGDSNAREIPLPVFTRATYTYYVSAVFATATWLAG